MSSSCRSLALAGMCLLPILASSQPASGLRLPPVIDRVKAAEQGKELVAKLLAEQPQESTNEAVLRVRPAGGRQRKMPVRIEVTSTATNWMSTYRVAMGGNGTNGAELTIVHTTGQPNQYLLTDPGTTNSPGRKLTGGEAMLPFAGTDFWIADLGLEFLHWPKQYLLRREMKSSLFCDVLESVQPDPSPGGYARVEAWFQAEPPFGLVRAEAYDVNNRLLKLFVPTELAKINGQYQVEEIEMQNRRSGSYTWIKFNLPLR